MSFAPIPPLALPPLPVARETFLLRCAQPAFGAPLTVNLNSLVIRGSQPVVVDTGPASNRNRWLADLASVVDPADVRWIVISHDDRDHTGNLAVLLEQSPHATVVGTWAMSERMGCEINLPIDRLRWLDDGGTLDVGDRLLHAVRPPVYDSPTTRAIWDGTTRVLWGSDMLATPMPAEPAEHVADIPPDMWADGLAMFHHHALSPWLAMVDRNAYAAQVQRLLALDPAVVVGAHTPVVSGESVAAAFDHVAALPDVVPPPHPDQRALDAALAGAVG